MKEYIKNNIISIILFSYLLFQIIILILDNNSWQDRYYELAEDTNNKIEECNDFKNHIADIEQSKDYEELEYINIKNTEKIHVYYDDY